MKTILVLSMILAASVSNALECSDVARIDAGYAVTIGEAQTVAMVYKVSKADRTLVGTLFCTDPQFEKPSNGNQTYTTLICSEPQKADAGYAVFLQTDGSSGNISAILSEVSLVGSAKIADLYCN